jgi:hypothetical protein
MWETRCLTTLWVFMACYRDSFAFTFHALCHYFSKWCSVSWAEVFRHWNGVMVASSQFLKKKLIDRIFSLSYGIPHFTNIQFINFHHNEALFIYTFFSLNELHFCYSKQLKFVISTNIHKVMGLLFSIYEFSLHEQFSYNKLSS